MQSYKKPTSLEFLKNNTLFSGGKSLQIDWSVDNWRKENFHKNMVILVKDQTGWRKLIR